MQNKYQISNIKSQINTNIIKTILDQKKKDLKGKLKLESLFKNAIVQASKHGVAIIGEIKFASPTHPHLGSASELLDRARAYEKAGADAISIITEKHFFKGDIGFVSRVKKSMKIPVLQKDFVIDEQQIYEAKSAGADALLLIARIVSKSQLQQFVMLAQTLRIEPVVEIHNQEDLKKAIATKTLFIAVNARDLNTFTIDVEAACGLMKKIPDRFIKLGFSGIQSRAEVQKYTNAGAKGVLIGTSLMKAKNIQDFIKNLKP